MAPGLIANVRPRLASAGALNADIPEDAFTTPTQIIGATISRQGMERFSESHGAALRQWHIRDDLESRAIDHIRSGAETVGE